MKDKPKIEWICCGCDWDDVFTMGGIADPTDVSGAVLHARHCPVCGKPRTLAADAEE